MNIVNLKTKKITRAYRKRLKYLLDLQLKSERGFTGYVLTYLSFIRDRLILKNDFRTAGNADKVAFDESTTKVSEALAEYAKYEEALAKYKILTAIQNEASVTEEQTKVIEDLSKECFDHWTAFWKFIELNIALVEDWAHV